MINVMIHACPARMWYVNEYMVPSMIAQGIDQNDITIWNDSDGIGCLASCMASFKSLPDDGATWHLQDDVLIAHDFAERVQHLNGGAYDVVCGFSHTLFEPFNRPWVGEAPAIFMFNSFPCIRIPNSMAKDFVRWFENDARHRPEYKAWVKSGKHDDSLWHDYFTECHSDEYVWNETPALVEHVDWLIGGSTVNTWRGYVCRAAYWDDEYLVEELQRKLARQ